MTKTVQQLEDEIFAGKTIRTEDLIDARQREEAASYIHAIEARRDAEIEKEQARKGRAEKLEGYRQTMEEIRTKSDPHLYELRIAVRDAILNYVSAAKGRNDVVSEIIAGVRGDLTAVADPDFRFPYRYDGDENGCHIGDTQINSIDWVTDLDRAVAKTIETLIPGWGPAFRCGSTDF